jgi:hypothetical protein
MLCFECLVLSKDDEKRILKNNKNMIHLIYYYIIFSFYIKGVFFKFGVEVGVGELIESAPLV